jgi:hypothetical protein
MLKSDLLEGWLFNFVAQIIIHSKLKKTRELRDLDEIKG